MFQFFNLLNMIQKAKYIFCTEKILTIFIGKRICKISIDAIN